MPKKFYSEADIEDLVKRGIRSLEVNDQVVLTDLAFEKARQLGLHLVGSQALQPPAAPIRPYVSEQQVSIAIRTSPASSSELHQRIRKAVIAKLGNQVDPTLLDTIISRVLQSTGLNKMLFGRVKGNAVCTIKYPGTEGLKLLVVQPLNKHLEPVGPLQVAADVVQAGVGDLCLMARSREAALALPDVKFVPIDLALIGIVDELRVLPDGDVDITLKRGWNQFS